MTDGKEFNFESEVFSVGLINEKWEFNFEEPEVSSVGLINGRWQGIYLRVGSVFCRPDKCQMARNLISSRKCLLSA